VTLAMGEADEHLPTETFQIPPNAELRIEVGEARCYITVTSGSAEVFGAVVQPHRRIELQHTKIAIFTFEGCGLSLNGFPVEPACAPNIAASAGIVACNDVHAPTPRRH
jgi:hypothetical protein